MAVTFRSWFAPADVQLQPPALLRAAPRSSGQGEEGRSSKGTQHREAGAKGSSGLQLIILSMRGL